MIDTKMHGFRYREALVGFGGTPSLWWMHFLKKGFYHCIVALGKGRQWILIDPLIHYTDLIVINDGNMEGYLKKQGYTVIKTYLREPVRRHLSIMPYTCVETVKRFVGIRNWRIFTPYQLYRSFLTENRKIILDIGKKV